MTPSFSNRTLPTATAVVVGCFLLFACSKPPDAAKPAPQLLTRDIVGYFCGMIVEDHRGPKSQIIVAGKAQALWFTSVRDGIAFTMLPEESAKRSAFYVTAMDKGSWDHPEQQPGAWIDASAAWYVIDSSQSGGMGMPEVIPFSTEKQHRNLFTSMVVRGFAILLFRAIISWGMVRIEQGFLFQKKTGRKSPHYYDSG
jgi:copper chaperone NosL